MTDDLKHAICDLLAVGFCSGGPAKMMKQRIHLKQLEK